MTPAQARERFAAARVARLATVGEDGRPHLVPIVFALAGDTVYHAVDHKPKRTTALRRLDNIATDPRVALLADEYEDGDWSRLWWVRADGLARVLEPDCDEARAAVALLAERYAQYRELHPAGPVVAVDVDRWTGWAVTDAATPSGTAVAFAGHSWGVKSSAGAVGPGPNIFSDSPENVWVDAAGRLHLRITRRDGRWRCAEVVLDRSLGYGTYAFTIASPVGLLDPNVVLGLFTYSDDPADNHREIDIEFARWGDAVDATNAQFVVQPSTRPQNVMRFGQPDAAPSAHAFTWTRESVVFASATQTGHEIARWRYGGADIPRADSERMHINLWLHGGRPPEDGAAVELVLSSFAFSR